MRPSKPVPYSYRLNRSGVGSTLEQVKAQYPQGEPTHGGYQDSMTGDVGWMYVFVLDAERVVGIRMQRLTADCAQQGEQR